MQPGNNVEVLGFTQQPAMTRKPTEEAPVLQMPDFEAIIRQLHDTTFAAYRVQMTKDIMAATDGALNRMLAANQGTVAGVFKAIGTILAVRFTLLLALCGAFALAWSAMSNPIWPTIAILISYVLLTVLPLVWLDRNGRRSQNE